MTEEQPYDGVAELYAEKFSDSLSSFPLERGLLTAFAELAKAVGGPVADLGCGPGYVTAHLNSLGLDAFGVDMSSGMLAQARARHPELRFELGSMAALDIADASMSGILSRYSIIHTAPDDVPAVLAEFHRILIPGGHAFISFLGGATPRSRPLPMTTPSSPPTAGGRTISAPCCTTPAWKRWAV